MVTWVVTALRRLAGQPCSACEKRLPVADLHRSVVLRWSGHRVGRATGMECSATNPELSLVFAPVWDACAVVAGRLRARATPPPTVLTYRGGVT